MSLLITYSLVYILDNIVSRLYFFTNIKNILRKIKILKHILKGVNCDHYHHYYNLKKCFHLSVYLIMNSWYMCFSYVMYPSLNIFSTIFLWNYSHKLVLWDSKELRKWSSYFGIGACLFVYQRLVHLEVSNASVENFILYK